jgi:hypothetical protein
MNINNNELINHLNDYNKPLESYTCPHCDTFCNILHDHINKLKFNIKTKETNGIIISIICPKCHETSIFFIIAKSENIIYNKVYSKYDIKNIISIKQIYPRQKSIAKTLPDYIPKPLISIYKEMCELFPININASILWSRKWLEKFIINYWKDIPKTQNSLYKKIQWLETENKIQDTQLLDDLRFISNKGGHIESPTEDIIFKTSECELCISIIEDLIEEYYIEPFEKRKRKDNLHTLREQTKKEEDRIKKTK